MKRNYQKTLSLVLALVMMVTMLPAHVAVAANTPTITMGNATADVADAAATVTLPMRIENNPGFGGMQMNIGVPEGWAVTKFEYRTKSEFGIFYAKNDYDEMELQGSGETNPGEKTFAFTARENLTVDGTFCWVTVSVPQNILNGKYTIEIIPEKISDAVDTVTNMKDQFALTHGTITVTDGLEKSDLAPQINAPLANATYKFGDEFAELSAQATLPYPDLCEAPTYQWYKNTTNSTANGTVIAGATDSTYTPDEDYGTYYYYCVVTTKYNGEDITTTSNVAEITYSKAALPKDRFLLEEDSFVYDGTEKSPAVSTFGAAGQMPLLAGVDWQIVRTCQSSATKAGTYTISVEGLGNYEGTIDWTWTIERAGVTVPMAEDGLTYNGEDQIGVSSGEGYTITDNEKKDAGNYTAVATPDENHKWADGTTDAKNISWTIAPKSVAVEWSNTELTYNGKEQAPVAAVETGIAGETLVPVVTGGRTNKGEYTATAAISNANYTLTNTEIGYSIAAKSVDVVWDNTTLTYNGKEQAPTATVETGVEGENLTVSVSGARKDAGEYNATASIDNDNYELTEATKTTDFEIAAATEFTDATNKEQNVVINVGTFTEPKFTGVGGEDVDVELTYTYMDETMAAAEAKTADEINTALKALEKGDTAVINYSFEATGNYSGTGNGTITVTMVDIIFQVGDADATVENAVTIKTDATYGETWADIVKINETAIVASVDGDSVPGTYTLNVSGVPDAGEDIEFKVLFNATGELAERYKNVEVIVGTLDVAAKKVAVTWSNTALTYNGEAQAPTATAVGIDNYNIPVTVTGHQMDAGEGYEAAAATEDTNYELTGTTTFTIAPAQMDATVTVGANSDSVVKGTGLTANVTGDFDELSYQWLKDGQIIEGATSQSYTVDAGMADSLISVQVTSSGNYVGTATSEGTEVGRIVLTGNVEIEGEAAVGSELTANVTSEGTYVIVWMADEVLIENASGSPYIVAKADQGKTITAKIVGTGDYKDEVVSNGIAIPAGRPDAVVLTAKGNSGKVTLSWTAPANNGAAITGYQVKMDGEGQEWISVAADQTSYVFTGLTNGTEYTFSIKATNAVGDSEVTTVTARPRVVASGGGLGGGITVKPDDTEQPEQPEQPKDTVTTKTDAAGNKATVTQKVDGSVEVKTELNDKVVADAVKNDTAVELPMDPVTVGDKATEVTVETGTTEKVKVEIPVTETTSGTVVVLIKEDGTEQIIRDCVVTENGVVADVSDGDKIVVKDNSKEFNDVADHWGKGAVDFVTARDLFAGVGNDNFAPDVATNRGMIAQVLHNLEYNEDYAHDGHSFPDVGEHHWYDNAVHWAEDHGIVGGYGDGTFQGEKEVSREELVVMLWNYAGKQTSKDSSRMNSYNDAANVSDWAKEAMSWALENGVLSGKGGNLLDPTGMATRAELAQMMKNYLENV